MLLGYSLGAFGKSTAISSTPPGRLRVISGHTGPLLATPSSSPHPTTQGQYWQLHLPVIASGTGGYRNRHLTWTSLTSNCQYWPRVNQQHVQLLRGSARLQLLGRRPLHAMVDPPPERLATRTLRPVTPRTTTKLDGVEHDKRRKDCEQHDQKRPVAHAVVSARWPSLADAARNRSTRARASNSITTI
jgi:hypothetical protein